MCLIFSYFTIILLLVMSSVASLIVHLMQTWFDFEHDVIDTATDQWRNHLRSHAHVDGKTHALR